MRRTVPLEDETVGGVAGKAEVWKLRARALMEKEGSAWLEGRWPWERRR